MSLYNHVDIGLLSANCTSKSPLTCLFKDLCLANLLICILWVMTINIKIFGPIHNNK